MVILHLLYFLSLCTLGGGHVTLWVSVGEVMVLVTVYCVCIFSPIRAQHEILQKWKSVIGQYGSANLNRVWKVAPVT